MNDPYLAAYRLLQGLIIIYLIWPEMIDYYVASKSKPLAKHLFMEHLGKIFYIVMAGTIFFITSQSQSFYIFGIQVGWFYVAAEIILFTPLVVRRLKS